MISLQLTSDTLNNRVVRGANGRHGPARALLLAEAVPKLEAARFPVLLLPFL